MKNFALTALACLLLPALAGCDEGIEDNDDLGQAEGEDVDPDAGDPDAGDPDAGDPDAGDPDAGQAEGEPLPEEPTGQLCDIYETPAAACSDGTTAYCSNMDVGDPSEFGPCLADDELECQPGDHMDLGPHGDEWLQEVCGNRYSLCEVWGGEPMWQEQYCNTPLVLSLDGAPVELIEAEATPAATFDISMQDEACIATDWPTAATPWLALDRDGDGSISGGDELFGSGTRLAKGPAHARDGFAALAELDDNGDGFVDAKDAHFGELLLWRDHDADRRSIPGELSLVAESGVSALPVASAGGALCDSRGNCAAMGGTFESAAGVGQVIDVYLGCQ